MAKKVGFLALGCKVNQYEVDSYIAMFKEAGFETASFDEICDIYVINTCSVTNLGDRKSRQMIRRAKKQNPSAKVVVTGCYAQVSYDEVNGMEEVDLCLGTTLRSKIVELTQKMINGEDINAFVDIMKVRQFEELECESVTERTRANIKIQDGCDNFCSYCIVPYARGPVRSRRLESILNEAKRIASLGFKEVVLTGISVASYGKDTKECSLIDVIEEVCEIEGIERVRLSSIDPVAFTDDFIERLSAQRKVCDHFHISLQSGSNAVLKNMNRKYTTEAYLDMLRRIRLKMPDAGITTDVIEGFPLESEENFLETKAFVEKARFSKIHVFPYSERKGTAAAMMPQHPMPVREKRAKELSLVAEKLREDFEKSFVGRRVEVLFEQTKDNLTEGLTKNYLRVFVDKDETLHDECRVVEILKYDNEKLIGAVIK